MRLEKKTLLIIAALLMLVGCGSDDDNGDDPNGTEGPNSSDTNDADGGDDTDTATSGGEDLNVAIDEDFENWEAGDARFFMAKPDYTDGRAYTYDDNATMQTVDGQNCLYIHDDVVANGDYGFAVEMELAFDRQTDMSGEDYEISFDVYVPQDVVDKQAHVQFAFYEHETGTYKCIYSVWYTTSVVAGTWSTLSGPINTAAEDDGGVISYSGFSDDQNPSSWIFDVVRVQLIIDGDTAASGDEVWMCVDNMRVAKQGS